MCWKCYVRKKMKDRVYLKEYVYEVVNSEDFDLFDMEEEDEVIKLWKGKFE